MKFETQPKTNDFLNTFYSNRLISCISKPTHITHTSATLINNIVISSQNIDNVSSGILLYYPTIYLSLSIGEEERFTKTTLNN